MCLTNTAYKGEKLYVHTSTHDVVVNKAEFLDLLRKSYQNVEVMLSKSELNALYAIFCHEVGIIKLDFSIMESKFDFRTYSMELKLKSFEEVLNEVLSKILK